MTSVAFDSFELNSGFFRVNKCDTESSPAKITTMLQLARAHGSKRVFEKYDAKNIVVSGMIVCTTQVELQDQTDLLKNWLRRESGALRRDYSTGYREWVCTAKNVIVPIAQENISFGPYSIEFECESPFATDGVTDTWMNATAITTATSDTNITVNGTMDGQPVITITVTAINPTVSDVTMTIANTSNSQYLDITATFAAGDIVTVDCENNRVFINGILVKSSGQFPYWATGSGVLHYEDTATTRTLAVTATSERRYL